MTKNKNISSTTTTPVAPTQSKFRQSPQLNSIEKTSTMMISTAKEFGISGTAACLAHLIHHPLYTLKSQMMYHGHNFSPRRFIRQITTQPSFLYNGLVPRMVGIMPEKAMKMQAWIIVGRYIEKKYDNLKYTKSIIAGGAAGAATFIVGCPSERVMVLAQVQKQGFFKVITTTGFKGLYKGWTATLYRDMMFNIVFFTSRGYFVEQYTTITGTEPQAFKRVALGLPAGCLSSIVSCPLDVIKTRMQGQELNAEYKSFSQIFVNIVRQEGPRNLMKGLLPRLIAVPSMMSVFYVINEELEKLFTN